MSPAKPTRGQACWSIPAEAFRYFRTATYRAVICEEKHMGSRAVVIVCRDEKVAAKRSDYQRRKGYLLHAHGTNDSFKNRNASRIPREFMRALTQQDSGKNSKRIGSGTRLRTHALVRESGRAILRGNMQQLAPQAQASLKQAVEALLEHTAKRHVEAHGCSRNASNRLKSESIREKPTAVTAGKRTGRHQSSSIPSSSNRRQSDFTTNHQWHMDTLAKISRLARHQ